MPIEVSCGLNQITDMMDKCTCLPGFERCGKGRSESSQCGFYDSEVTCRPCLGGYFRTIFNSIMGTKPGEIPWPVAWESHKRYCAAQFCSTISHVFLPKSC